MPGKRITNNQIRLFMQSKARGKSLATAAAQAGLSERSAYNLAVHLRLHRINEIGKQDKIPLKRSGKISLAFT